MSRLLRSRACKRGWILAGPEAICLLAWLGTQMFRIGVSDASSETEEEPHLSLNL